MTEELKEKLKNAKTPEDAQKIISEYKQPLSDEELEEISGGVTYTFTKAPKC